MRRLNNLTVCVAAGEFAEVSAFYRPIFPEVLFEGDDIICLEAVPERAICVHVEGELGRRAGDAEAIFWIESDAEFLAAAGAVGLAPENIGVGLQLRDPTGRPPGSSRSTRAVPPRVRSRGEGEQSRRSGRFG